MERKYLTRSMPLLTPNHSFRTCGGPEAFGSTECFEKCGGKSSSRGQKLHILKTHFKHGDHNYTNYIYLIAKRTFLYILLVIVSWHLMLHLFYYFTYNL